jgi:hypothetical protein
VRALGIGIVDGGDPDARGAQGERMKDTRGPSSEDNGLHTGSMTAPAPGRR